VTFDKENRITRKKSHHQIYPLSFLVARSFLVVVVVVVVVFFLFFIDVVVVGSSIKKKNK